MELFGTGTVTLRLPSALFAAGCVPLTYLLARRLRSRRTARLATPLAAASLPLVYWGQMVRGYTLATLLALGATLCFAVALDTGRRAAFAGYALCAIALCYTLLIAALVVVAHLAALGFARRREVPWRRLLPTVGLAGLACTPLLALATGRGASQLFWLAPPTPSQVRNVVGFLASARAALSQTASAPALMELTVALFCVAAAVVALERVVGGPSRASFGAGLPVVWLALPPTIAFVVSMRAQPVFLDRYFAVCLPAAAIVLADLLARLRVAPLAWGVCAALVGLRLVQIPPTYGQPVDDWRSATGYVLAAARPGDCVAFYSNDGRVDFAYYLATARAAHEQVVAPRPVLPSAPWGENPAVIERYATLGPSALARVVASCPRTFLVAAHVGHLWGTPASRANAARFLSLRDRLAVAYPVHSVRRFPAISVFCFGRTLPVAPFGRSL